MIRLNNIIFFHSSKEYKNIVEKLMNECLKTEGECKINNDNIEEKLNHSKV